MQTLTQQEQIIHRMYEGNTSYPTAGDEDWTLRLGYLNDAVNIWATERGINWRQLFTTLSVATTGDDTTVLNQTAYDMPDDFMFISSLVKVGDVTLSSISADEVMNKGTSDQYYYITGNSDTGYVLNINPAPAAGLTIDYSYYKEPTLLSDASDKMEMSKPYYAVYFCLARLYEQDLRNDLVTFYEDKARNMLDEMVIDNEVAPYNNQFNLKDLYNDLYGFGFGRHE